MDNYLITQLQSQLEDTQRELVKFQNAAQENHERWMREVNAREALEADGLNRVAECYPVSVLEFQTLVRGFGELAMTGFKIDHVVAALIMMYPNKQAEIYEAFGLR